jgi:hypothetical protein
MVGGNLIASEEMIFIYNGVNFTAMVPPIPQSPPQTTFYVRPDGNDNNSGFANTPAAAFLTISGAMYAIKQRYISQNQITIRVADGTYIDAITESTNYIASWNIIGNTSNPGNIVINATSVNQSAYPPHAAIAQGCGIAATGNVILNGFTLQSYYQNVIAANGGFLQVFNCAFTAPTAGNTAPIFAGGAGKLFLYGNCSYNGAIAAPMIFSANGSGFLSLGYNDNINTTSLIFNINGTPIITGATIIAQSSGSVEVYNAAVSFTGGVPACKQYVCQTGGGITFTTGVTTIFPGTLPGVVTSPGWTD